MIFGFVWDCMENDGKWYLTRTCNGVWNENLIQCFWPGYCRDKRDDNGHAIQRILWAKDRKLLSFSLKHIYSEMWAWYIICKILKLTRDLKKKRGRLYKFISLNTYAVRTIRVWRPTDCNGWNPRGTGPSHRRSCRWDRQDPRTIKIFYIHSKNYKSNEARADDLTLYDSKLTEI